MLRNLFKIGLPSGVCLPQQLPYPAAVTGINSYKVVASQQAGLDLSVRSHPETGAVSAELGVVHGPHYLHLCSVQEVLLSPVHLASADRVRPGRQPGLDGVYIPSQPPA